MSSRRLLALLLVWGLACGACAQTSSRHHSSKKKPVTAAKTDVTKAKAKSSSAPAHSATNPPEVVYADGLLAITAENSTLDAVLSAVRTSTGANVEVPSGLRDRVVVKLGPAPANEVLAQLLNGSGLDYVIVGSPSDPKTLGSVLITRNSNRSAVEAAAAQVAPVEAVTNPGAASTEETPTQSAENETPPEPPTPAPYVDHRSAAEKYLGLPPGVEPTEEDLKRLPSSYPAGEGRVIWSSSGPISKPPKNFSRFGMQQQQSDNPSSSATGQANSPQDPLQTPPPATPDNTAPPEPQ